MKRFRLLIFNKRYAATSYKISLLASLMLFFSILLTGKLFALTVPIGQDQIITEMNYYKIFSDAGPNSTLRFDGNTVFSSIIFNDGYCAHYESVRAIIGLEWEIDYGDYTYEQLQGATMKITIDGSYSAGFYLDEYKATNSDISFSNFDSFLQPFYIFSENVPLPYYSDSISLSYVGPIPEPGHWNSVYASVHSIVIYDVDHSYPCSADVYEEATIDSVTIEWSMTGACCLDDGTCPSENMTETECQAQSGYYDGSWKEGLTCAQADCQPFGACCLDDGTCSSEKITEAECQAQSGYYDSSWKEGLTCAQADCQSVGACCLDGICNDTSYTWIECELDNDGVFFEEKSCEEVKCTLGACCLSESNCRANMMKKQCQREGGKNWVEYATSCENINCAELAKPKIRGLFIYVDHINTPFKKDATEMYNYFEKYKNEELDSPVGLDPRNPVEGGNLEEIKIAMDIIRDELRPGDSFVLYISAHGWQDQGGGRDDYVKLSNGDSAYPNDVLYDDVLTQWLSNDEPNDWGATWNDVNKLVIGDFCNAGGFWGSDEDPNPSDGGDLDKLEKVAFFAAALKGKTTDYLYNYQDPDDETNWSIYTQTFREYIEEHGLTPDTPQLSEDLKNWDMSSFIGETVLEKEFGDPIIFDMSRWNPEVYVSEDFEMGALDSTVVANAGPNQEIQNKIVSLDGNESYDPRGEIVSYEWFLNYRIFNFRFPSNNKTATGPTPTVTGLAKGYYDVTLTVTDNDGLTGIDTMTVTSCFVSSLR